MTINPERTTSTESTPYTRSTAEMLDLMNKTLSDEKAVYMDAASNPDLGHFVIASVDGNDERSDVGKTLEVGIFERDWGYPKDFLEETFTGYDDRSSFLILIDNEDPREPKAAGVLRILDCKDGESESVEFYKEFFGEDAPVPPELQPNNPGDGLWDIVTVATLPEYRGGETSAWLYNALYNKSIEAGVNKWTANVTPKEMKNLRQLIGIPFMDVPNVDKIVEIVPRTGQEAVFGFYSISVDTIEPQVSERIELYESKSSGMSQAMARLARIALKGAVQE